MSNLSVTFKFLTAVRDEGGRSPSRAGVRFQVNLEALEGRALLSNTPLLAAQATGQTAALVQVPKHPHPGPIVNEVGTGYAVKSPRFYPYYTGLYRAELNAAGMKATYDAAGDLVLTGIVAGPITETPSSDAGNEYYVFAINRGLSSGVAPFPDRPNIKYDALVYVALTAEGVSGDVIDLNTNTVTPIDPSGIVVPPGGSLGGFPQAIKVYVPAGTPGIDSTVAGAVNPRVVFWAQDTPLTSVTPNPDDVASFAPDGRTVPIAGGAGITPKQVLL